MRLSLLSLALRSSLAASTIGLLSTAAMAEESNTTDAATAVAASVVLDSSAIAAVDNKPIVLAAKDERKAKDNRDKRIFNHSKDNR